MVSSLASRANLLALKTGVKIIDFSGAPVAFMFGSLSALFTAMILTRTSFESKTKTAISLASGVAMPILIYMNPSIGLVALAILWVIAAAVVKELPSTDEFLKWIIPAYKRNFPPINFDPQPFDDANFCRQRQEMINRIWARPLIRPPVINPLEQRHPPRYVLPPLFFNPFRMVRDPQPLHAKGG
jgi:hypothetical protein